MPSCFIELPKAFCFSQPMGKTTLGHMGVNLLVTSDILGFASLTPCPLVFAFGPHWEDTALGRPFPDGFQLGAEIPTGAQNRRNRGEELLGPVD